MEKLEENFEQPKMTQDDLVALVGARVAEIRDYYSESPEDWIGNFKEKLGEIKTLLDSREAEDLVKGSIRESSSLRISNLIKNLDNLNPAKLTGEIKRLLLKDLDRILE
jgi:hypothetical protein